MPIPGLHEEFMEILIFLSLFQMVTICAHFLGNDVKETDSLAGTPSRPALSTALCTDSVDI
jgi:hypothetical protein